MRRHRKAEQTSMMNNGIKENQGFLEGMIWIGGGVAALVVLLRVWLLPAAADWQTGLFTSNYWVIGLMVGALVALAALQYVAGPIRREIVGTPAVVVALASMLTGLVMMAVGVLDVLKFYGILEGGTGIMDATNAGLMSVLSLLEYAFCALGGLALLRLGLVLLSEGATRRGIAQWSVLAPVLWAWFRLIGYEMSYASMVRIEDNFFGFVMLIVELLFLFRLARFVSGIGRVGAASLMFHAMATVLFAVSGPLTRVGMYLLEDNMAYTAYHLAGPLDMAVGILALVVGVALLGGEEVFHPSETMSDAVDREAEEASAVISSDLLLNLSDEEEE